MKYFVQEEQTGLFIRFTVQSDDALAHGSEYITRGQSFFGIPFDQLAADGPGEHEVTDQQLEAFFSDASER